MFLVDVFVYKIIKIIKIISFTTGAHQRTDLEAQGGDFLFQGRVFLAGKSIFGREEYFLQGREGQRRVFFNLNLKVIILLVMFFMLVLSISRLVFV